MELTIPAADGYPLKSTLLISEASDTIVIIASATAVPRRFYRHLAEHLNRWGATVVTFDYRGVGESRPASLVGFEADFSQWGSLDIKGVLRWAREQNPSRLFLVGHSAGGQVAALADEPVDAMVTVSSQSGYWKLQGGTQKLAVCFHMHVTFPILSKLFGYMPWSRLGSSEDLPKGVALQWARWCRHPHYLFGDTSLDLSLYQRFTAPILAYSIDDDPWGTRASVDSMMGHYPNVERRHLKPGHKLGHFGYFRKHSAELWAEITDFFESLAPGAKGEGSGDAAENLKG